MIYQEMDANMNAVETIEIDQGSLTADCWLVQIKGIRACAECEYLKKPDCGGGLTLLGIIGQEHEERFGRDYPPIVYMYGRQAMEESGSFYQLLKNADKYTGMWQVPNYYNRILRDIRVKDEAKATRERNLDEMFPYGEISQLPNWKRTAREGWHDPDKNICGCVKVTPKAAYRDETYEDAHGNILHYYHQHCIVAKTSLGIYLDSCGWRTVTTKARMNQYLPGYSIWSDRGVWWVRKGSWYDTDNQKLPFHDGMLLS
jgi:hypothetical protein